MNIEISQRNRVLALILESALVVICSYFAFGQPIPPTTDKGLWFYTALFSIILGNRILTPYYIKPIDVVSYSLPAIFALIYLNDANWGATEKALYYLAFGVCSLLTIAAFIQILTKDSTREPVRLFSESLRLSLTELGRPQFIYSLVMLFSIWTFHRESASEVFWIGLAWALTVASSPIESLFKVVKKIYGLWKLGVAPEFYGDVVAYQKPNIILFREASNSIASFGMPVLIKDLKTKDKVAIILDNVGRDEGLLKRCVEIDALQPAQQITKLVGSLPDRSVSKLLKEDITSKDETSKSILEDSGSLVGIVAPETSITRLYFEEVQENKITEGRLVKTFIAEKPVLYQIIGGKTNEEQVYQKNMNGFTRVEAQKIGLWDDHKRHFELIKWLPPLNTPVFLLEEKSPEPDHEAIGYFPKSNYAAHIKNIHELVTHNTAILGILGIGKSSLSFELVERMLSKNIKVICLDLTDEYADELKEFCYDSTGDVLYKKLESMTGDKGKDTVSLNVEEGGSKPPFQNALNEYIEKFINEGQDKNLLVFNPANFAVWRQDSKPYQGKASMASLSPTAITQLFTEAALLACQNLGKVKKGEARVCMVYEEAHSLIPEWNTVVNEGDKDASNGTARAILQGRKFGLGCLIISQRTANVTKTILNQCNTIFAMRTFDDTGMGFLSNYVGNDYAEALPSLQERHAVFFGKASKCENPIMIRLNDREDFKKVFREKFPIPKPKVNEATPVEQIAATIKPTSNEEDTPF